MGKSGLHHGFAACYIFAQLRNSIEVRLRGLRQVCRNSGSLIPPLHRNAAGERPHFKNEQAQWPELGSGVHPKNPIKQ